MRHRRPTPKAVGASAPPADAWGHGRSPTPSAAITKTSPPPRHRRRSLPWTEMGLFVGILGIYARTLYPSVAGGDSGELVAESCHLGISHPPGYPLFNMLVFAAMTLSIPGFPQKSMAWKANLFSAACDALTAVVLYRCIVLWTSHLPGAANRRTAAFTAAALFALSPLIWTYAVGAEVFALNNLFAAALVHTLLRYSLRWDRPTALRGAFLCGLGLCNQHTIVLFELPIIPYVIWTRLRVVTGDGRDRGRRPWTRELGLLALAFVAGLVPYVYMPLRARLAPQPGSWGDVASFSGFVRHLRRADYGTFRLFSTDRPTEGLRERLWLYARDLVTREMPFQLAVPVVLVGALVTTRGGFLPRLASADNAVDVAPRDRKHRDASTAAYNAVGQVVVGMYAFYMLVFHALANLPLDEGLTYGVHMRFWQQPNVIVFLWLGVGLAVTLDAIARAGVARLAVVGRGLVLGLVVAQGLRWFATCDQSTSYFIRDYARALLEPLPEAAVLVVNYDLQWTALRYLQRCELLRPDIILLNLSMMSYQWFATKHGDYPTLRFPGTRVVPYGSSSDGFTFAQFLDANWHHERPRVRFFFAGKLNGNDPDLAARYAFIPFGLVDELGATTDGPPLALAEWYAAQRPVRSLVRERLPVLPPGDKYDDETWEWTIARDHGMKTLSWSTYLLEKTIAEDPHNLTLLSEATHAMEHAYQFEPRQFWSPAANLKNLGLAYAQIVKARTDFPDDQETDPFYNGAVGRSVGDWRKFKDRASTRMLEVWAEWLRVPEARQDPAFEAIRGVVERFAPTAKAQRDPEATASRGSKGSKKKQRNTRNKKTKTQKTPGHG